MPDDPAPLTIGLIALVIILTLFGFGLVVFCCRRKYGAACSSKQASDLDTLEYKTGKTNFDNLHDQSETKIKSMFAVCNFPLLAKNLSVFVVNCCNFFPCRSNHNNTGL